MQIYNILATIIAGNFKSHNLTVDSCEIKDGVVYFAVSDEDGHELNIKRSAWNSDSEADMKRIVQSILGVPARKPAKPTQKKIDSNRP